jgi:hypothetical protein
LADATEERAAAAGSGNAMISSERQKGVLPNYDRGEALIGVGLG